jgi:uncharacterized protein (TIGR00251 family)
MSTVPDPASYGITSHAGGVSIRVYVAPRSSASRVVGEHNGALKVALTAPPVEGAANKALVDLLSKLLGVPKGAVSIVAGETSRNKTVRVEGVTPDRAARVLLPAGDTT